jgi:hypothetical protein
MCECDELCCMGFHTLSKCASPAAKTYIIQFRTTPVCSECAGRIDARELRKHLNVCKVR